MTYPVMSRRRFLKLAATYAAAVPVAAPLQRATATGVPASIRVRGEAAKPNVVLVVADALRSDHVSANGYGRTVTPNLDRWLAADGVTFRQATTTVPWTFPANAALMAGRLPFRLNATWDNTVRRPRELS